MLTMGEMCEGLVGLDYFIKFVNYDNKPRIIVWKRNENDPRSLYPVADVLMEEFNKYNLNYSTFEALDIVGQIQLSSLIIQYANTPVEDRENMRSS